jgi:hypothetical protein
MRDREHLEGKSLWLDRSVRILLRSKFGRVPILPAESVSLRLAVSPNRRRVGKPATY